MPRQILRWMHILLLWSLLVTLGVWGHVVVQNSTTKPVASNTTIQSPTDASPREATRDVQSYKLPPETYQKAIAYSRARYWAYFIGSAYFLVILLVLLRCRIAPLRDTAMRASSRYAGYEGFSVLSKSQLFFCYFLLSDIHLVFGSPVPQGT